MFPGSDDIVKATEEGKTSDVIFLVEKGESPNLITINGDSLLHIATQNGHFKIVRYLIQRGANVNAISNKRSSLYLALQTDHFEISNYLIRHGAEINANDGDDLPLLHLAAQKGMLDIVQYLVDSQEDSWPYLNAKDDRQQTALHLAANQGLLNIVQCIVRGGADIEAKNGEKQTALHVAAMTGHFEVCKFLIDCRANINSFDQLNRTPLHFAANYGHVQIVSHLLAQSANINSFDCFNQTPLHYACLVGRLDIVQFLIDRGADVQPTNVIKIRAINFRRIPLHFTLFKFFDNLTPSRFASFNVRIVQSLQQNREDLTVKSLKRNLSPLDLAAQNGHLKVVKFLVKNGAKNISLKRRFQLQSNDVYHYLDYVPRN